MGQRVSYIYLFFAQCTVPDALAMPTTYGDTDKFKWETSYFTSYCTSFIDKIQIIQGSNLSFQFCDM